MRTRTVIIRTISGLGVLVGVYCLLAVFKCVNPTYSMLGRAETAAAIEVRVRLTEELLESVDDGDSYAGCCLPRKQHVFRTVKGETYKLNWRGDLLIWMTSPACGDRICIAGETEHISDSYERPIAIACSSKCVCGQRLFVFIKRMRGNFVTDHYFLKDEDLSWFYQVPMTELSNKEREQEQTYRERVHLKFPVVFSGE